MTRAFEVSYDGTAYAGLQIQRGVRTIQGVIEDRLEQVLKRPVRIAFAGRTDAGVHAIGQVISFRAESTMTGEQFVRALNALLPRDIRVMRALNVAREFHPRFSARSRWYRYIVWNGKELVPFFRDYALWLNRPVDHDLLGEYCGRITGVHDFTSFGSIGSGDNPVRRITHCEVRRKNEFILFDIVANSFLRKMVRTIVGTFLTLERERAPAARIDEILRAGDREAGGDTAFAGGLYLAKVFYDFNEDTGFQP
jgi:tRNA pseudouridine38-40 synthase